MRQASGDHCGTNTSILRSLLTTFPTTNVFAGSGRIPYNVLDLKLGIRPQQQLIPSQMAEDVLEQTEMIHQDVRKKAMQAYIKYKAYYDKMANASKLKEADYVYVLHPKADHQRSKIPFTGFRWTGPYIIEKMLPKKTN